VRTHSLDSDGMEEGHLRKRVTLADALPTIPSVLRNFHRKVELVEPTLKNVVVLYGHSVLGEREATNDPSVSEHPNSIRIKVFHDIPLADLELVFAFKTVTLQYLDLVASLVTVALGVWLIHSQSLVGPLAIRVLEAILLLIAARAISVFQVMRNARSFMEREMQRTFVHKSKDNDEGALHYLMESWETQEVKEMLLAYTYSVLLSQNSSFNQFKGAGAAGVDPLDLKTTVEAELKSELELDAHLDITGALQKLHQHRVVSYDGDTVRPMPIVEAVDRLKDKWAKYLRVFERIDGDPTPGSVTDPSNASEAPPLWAPPPL